MPADTVRKLNAAVVEALQQPDVRARLARDAIVPRPLDVAAFHAFFKSEDAKWGALAREVMGTSKP
jgi:tripartite-type tricarboxylate transporter receptor subunit TctC